VTVYTSDPVYDTEDITMTGWANGDPNQFAGERTIDVPPILKAYWATFGPSVFGYHFSTVDITPHSGGNNETDLQVRSDDGAWHSLPAAHGVTSTTFQPREIFEDPSTPADPPGLVVGDTLSFRAANITDFTAGLFTPRTWHGAFLELYADIPPDFVPPPPPPPPILGGCHIPMTLTSNVKMLRVITDPVPPLTILTPGGVVDNPDSFGPLGWHLVDFDDSTWTTPVLVDPVIDQSLSPLHYIAGSPFNVTILGDPLWVTATEADPESAILIRWRFTPPISIGPTAFTAALYWNVGRGQLGPTHGYLNLTSNEDAYGQSYVLGDDDLANAGGIGDVLLGQENLLALVFGVHPNSTVPGASSFALIDILYDCGGGGVLPVLSNRARSYAQIIG
jgi:hypothetical protein